MTTNHETDSFLSQYDRQTYSLAVRLREMLLQNLPGILEKTDIPAKMIGYSYGNRYIDLICVMIPSKKGLKLGFNRGTQLPDPVKLLEGTGKISRYVIIRSQDQINSQPLINLISDALTTYRQLVH